jgi:hypothetical protein
LAGIAEILIVIPVGGEIGLGVEAANGDVGDRAETRVAVLVEVGAGGRADRLFRSLLERRGQSFLSPGLLRWSGMTVLEDVGNRALGDGLAHIDFSLVLGHSAPYVSSGVRL